MVFLPRRQEVRKEAFLLLCQCQIKALHVTQKADGRTDGMFELQIAIASIAPIRRTVKRVKFEEPAAAAATQRRSTRLHRSLVELRRTLADCSPELCSEIHFGTKYVGPPSTVVSGSTKHEVVGKK